MKIVLLLSGLFFYPSQAANVCAELRMDSGAQRAFPGAYAILCEKGQSPNCSARKAEGCTVDALCYRHFGSSNCDPGAGPCLPDYVYKRCQVMSKERLEKLVRYFQLCRKTGGSWMKSDGTQRYDGHCSCMGVSQEGLAFSQGGDAGIPTVPIKFFLDGRGCAPEEDLCKEIKGTWIPNARRSFCRKDGASVDWSRFGFKIGFVEQ